MPDRHSDFYWENMVVQVEDTLFHVPRHGFAQSEAFRDMFRLPAPKNGKGVEGQSDDHPIVLEGYKVKDFESFLKLLYPSMESGISGLAMTKEEWVGALKLATIWQMDKARGYAITKLMSMKDIRPAEAVNLAREYRISNWLLPALIDLAINRHELEDDGIEALVGLKTAFILRGIYLRANGGRPRTCAMVQEQFKEELIEIGAIEKDAAAAVNLPLPRANRYKRSRHVYAYSSSDDDLN
ncbi:hypothetical protein DFP72DRAFT_959572 [Ephemerocybe angulata]|uniref:BTB domain-containing protein n=1 Tax=Ephemerocybe angulata TaxID=980116 RepID=A0A8H6IAU2_9AGAR|nr:hypothetical protein DFP72DRAFT_959572 [Tulosesus angulatus]